MAALELVEALGYPRLTIEAVAARAGVGKQTIYRWWPSKGPLLFEAFVELGPIGQYPPTCGDLAADLRDELRAVVEELGERRFDQVCRALLHESRDDLLGLLLTPRRVRLEERLRAAQRTGEVRLDVDVAVAADLLLGAVHQRWLLRTAPLSERHTDAVVDLVLRALRG